MPSISSIDIASFAIANAAAGPDVARAFLLQGSLGANGPLIAAKLITDQFAAMQTQLAATTASADSLSATIAAQTAQIAEQQRIITALEQQRSDAQSPPAASEPAPEPQQQAAADDTAAALPRIAVGSDPAPDTPADAVTIAVGSEPAVAIVADGDTDPIVTPEPAADVPGEIARLRDALKQSEDRVRALETQIQDHDEIAKNLNEATSRLEQSEGELASLKQDHAALKAENVAFGDAAAILARQYRMADIDDAQWAAKLKKVRTAMEKSDTDNDALHMMLFVDHPELILDRFLFQMAQDDGTVDPAIIRDFHAVANELRPFTQKLEQRNAAAQQGEYVPAETFTVELALTALGQPAAGGDAPPASPETPTPPTPTPTPTPRPPRKSGRASNRTRK